MNCRAVITQRDIDNGDFLYETVDNVNFDLFLILHTYFKHFVIWEMR